MTEQFLQYLWHYQLYNPQSLYLANNEKVEIVHAGEQNTDAGPDFTNVKLKMDGILWVGNAEVHINSSDWFRHGHHKDKAYDNVIIQIVINHDAEIQRTNGEPIPTLKLEVDPGYYATYERLINSREWIACANEIRHVHSVVISSWLVKLMIERLENKAARIEARLENNRNNWEETFYQSLAENFGFKLNAQPFEMLAKSLPLRYLAKHKDNLLQLEAMLFGQAGMLQDEAGNEPYYQQLQKEYTILQKKFNLEPIQPHLWKFLRLRPTNFPTIRIAQFAALIHESSGLFAKVLEVEDCKAIQHMLTVSASAFWNDHYTFAKPTAKSKTKNLGKTAIHILLINTIIPFLFVYGKKKNIQLYKDRAIAFLEQLPPEKNHIIRRWIETGITPENALHSQALLQLKNSYCHYKNCLDCGIGNQLIKQHKA